MTRMQKLRGIAAGLVTILGSIIMILDSSFGFQLICAILCTMLFITGIRSLLYYFNMARYMVGGRRALYRGVILFDLGMFTMTLNDIPVGYIILYLMVIHAFAGAVDVLNALEARRLETPAWKGRLMYGAGNLAMAILCVIFGYFRGSVNSIVHIYAAGLFYSGVVRIVNSFRSKPNVYIQ